MGFVYEVVPEEDFGFLKEMRLLDCWGMKLLYIDKDTKWCADREKNAYLLEIGGGYKGFPNFCDLWWNGNVIRMEITRRATRNEEEEMNIVWYIHKIPIPRAIWENKEEILVMIKEAFEVNKSWCKDKKVNSISVKFMCEPEMMEDK